jgi:hypothetical protein
MKHEGAVLVLEARDHLGSPVCYLHAIDHDIQTFLQNLQGRDRRMG